MTDEKKKKRRVRIAGKKNNKTSKETKAKSKEKQKQKANKQTKKKRVIFAEVECVHKIWWTTIGVSGGFLHFGPLWKAGRIQSLLKVIWKIPRLLDSQQTVACCYQIGSQETRGIASQDSSITVPDRQPAAGWLVTANISPALIGQLAIINPMSLSTVITRLLWLAEGNSWPALIGHEP